MNLKKELIEIISKRLGIEKEKISLESDFYSDLNASKLEIVDLLLACQQEFKIDLEEGVVNQVKTVGDLLKLFEENSDEI